MNDIPQNDHLLRGPASLTLKNYVNDDFARLNKSPENPHGSVPNPFNVKPRESNWIIRSNYLMMQKMMSEIVEKVFGWSDKNGAVNQSRKTEVVSSILELIKYHDDVDNKIGAAKSDELINFSRAGVQFLYGLCGYADTDEKAYKLAREFPKMPLSAFKAYDSLFTPANRTLSAKVENDPSPQAIGPQFSAAQTLWLLDLCLPPEKRRKLDWAATDDKMWIEFSNQRMMADVERRGGTSYKFVTEMNNYEFWENKEYPMFRGAAYIMGGRFKELGLTSEAAIEVFSEKIQRNAEYAGAAYSLYILTQQISPTMSDGSFKDAKLAIEDLNHLQNYAQFARQKYGTLNQHENILVQALEKDEVKMLIREAINNPSRLGLTRPKLTCESTWNVRTKGMHVIDSVPFVERITEDAKAVAKQKLNLATA